MNKLPLIACLLLFISACAPAVMQTTPKQDRQARYLVEKLGGDTIAMGHGCQELGVEILVLAKSGLSSPYATASKELGIFYIVVRKELINSPIESFALAHECGHIDLHLRELRGQPVQFEKLETLSILHQKELYSDCYAVRRLVKMGMPEAIAAFMTMIEGMPASNAHPSGEVRNYVVQKCLERALEG